MTPANETPAAPVVNVQQLVADNDLGGRSPGPVVGLFLLCVALAWSLFQLWIASPLPFIFGILVFNDTESRAIHLAFAMFLASATWSASPHTCWARAPGARGRPKRASTSRRNDAQEDAASAWISGCCQHLNRSPYEPLTS